MTEPNLLEDFADFNPGRLINHLERMDRNNVRERKEELKQALRYHDSLIQSWMNEIEGWFPTKPDFAFANDHYWKDVEEMARDGHLRALLNPSVHDGRKFWVDYYANNILNELAVAGLPVAQFRRFETQWTNLFYTIKTDEPSRLEDDSKWYRILAVLVWIYEDFFGRRDQDALVFKHYLESGTVTPSLVLEKMELSSLLPSLHHHEQLPPPGYDVPIAHIPQPRTPPAPVRARSPPPSYESESESRQAATSSHPTPARHKHQAPHQSRPTRGFRAGVRRLFKPNGGAAQNESKSLGRSRRHLSNRQLLIYENGLE
ncbi:uncharacterized protein JCM6883_005747 [Sporobolomyces salmoneus]|uniref:uncharacterized protein n=1 Tax=Sporobolomyces salmoneus TaxID=183962 RepID=UPI003174EA63